MKLNILLRQRLWAVVLLLLGFNYAQPVPAFQHPGIPLTLADLDNIKSNLNTRPWSDGFAALASDYRSQLSYTMQGPFGYVNRNYYGTYDNENQWKNDMQAIFNLACMWYLTGDTNYAQKSHDILLAWANTMTNFNGIEAGLDVGDYATRYAGGADILRGTWPGWTTADTLTVSNFFRNVYVGPGAVDGDVLGPANKGSLSLVSMLAIALFNDDTNLFNHVLYLYRTSASCGLANNSLTSGQTGETGRDQGHAYNHLLQMAYCAEMFWKQGVDVYSELDNRLLACGEYYARNNLSPPAAYITYGTTDALYWNNSTNAGGSSAGGVYASEPTMGNILRSAYTLRKGLTTPWMILKRATQGNENGNSFLYLKNADSSTATPPAAINYPTAATVTTGLLNIDIGGAIPAGSGSYSGGIWTVKGGGAEIWGHGPDAAHFTYKQVTGDCTIIAKVNSVQTTAGTAKAGVMIRDSLSSSAANRAWIAVTPAQTAEAYMHGWTQCYGGSNWENASRGIPQSVYWVKLERHGNMINLYTSLDGTSWAVECAAQFNNMPSTVYLGLVVCSMNTSALNTATFSNVSITSGDGGNVTIPPAPYAIYASPDAGRVPLRWLQSFGATGYKVLRSMTNGGPYTTLATTTNASYVDTNVVPSTTYYYVIQATNSAGTSANSPQDSAITQPLPTPPTGLIGLPGNGQATLFWIPSSSAASYNVKRSATSGSGYATVTNITAITFVDSGLANGTPYYYVISSVNGGGEGANSSEASVTPSVSAATLFWSGAVNGTWDTSTLNWLNNGAASAFANGNPVVFDNSTLSNTTINLSASRSPGTMLVNNTARSFTIGGSAIAGTGKLIAQGDGTITFNNGNTYSGGSTIYSGTVTVGNNTALGSGAITLAGGRLFGGGSGCTLANSIQALTNTSSVIDCSANLTLNGNFTGGGTITRGSSATSSLYLGGNNSGFTGTYQDQNNGNSITRWTSANAGSANARWIFNQAQIASRTTPNFGTGTIQFGSITGNGFISQNSLGTATLQVGALGLNDTFGGSMQDGAGLIALTKVGSGTLRLTGANSYTGPTTVSQGALIIATASQAKGNYSVANGATLGVTNTAASSALASNLTVAAGSALEFQNIASTTTPLIAASNMTVNGSCVVKITGTNGLVASNSYPLVSYAGTFSGSFANLQLQMPYGWRGALAQAGKQIVLTNVAVVATTQPTLNATNSGAQVQLDWPATHTGWRLETQTNSLSTGLSANWFSVPDSATTNEVTLAINTVDGSVFFRLVYP